MAELAFLSTERALGRGPTGGCRLDVPNASTGRDSKVSEKPARRQHWTERGRGRKRGTEGDGHWQGAMGRHTKYVLLFFSVVFCVVVFVLFYVEEHGKKRKS